MKSSSLKIIIASLILMPVSLYAAAVGLGTLTTVANTLADGVVTSLGYLFFTVAVVAFFWGIVQFIWAARNGDAGDGVKNGKQFMLWGLIALFVMFSVWGIIQFAQGVFGLSGQTTITIPNIQLLGAPGSGTTNTTANTDPSASAVACQYQSTAGASLSCGIKNASNNCVPDAKACEYQNTANGTVSCGVRNASNACIPGAGGTTNAPTCTAPTVSDGTRCVDPSCQTSAPGATCTTKNAAGADVTGTCNNVKQCVPSTGGGSVGFGGSCQIDTQCSGDLRCDTDHVCRRPNGAACTVNTDCAYAGLCDQTSKVCR